MKKILYYLIAILFISIISPKNVSGTHIMGSDMIWKCIGQDKFLITLTVYRDCNGIQLSTNPVTFTSANTGQYITSIIIPVGIPIDITPVNSSGCTRCQSSSCYFPFGIQQHKMQQIVYLYGAPGCCDIILQWEQCCRNYAITTMNSELNLNFFMKAQLNRCQDPFDNSPVFSNIPVAILCNGQDFTYSHGVYDADTFATGGLCDSLVFSWTRPLEGKNEPISYTGQYAYNKPINFLGFPDTGLALPSGFHLNTETGDYSFRPMKNEVTVLVLNVKEYRNGQLIGIIRRDMQLIVISCDIVQPIISTNGSPKKNTVEIGESISLNFSTIDSSSEDSMFISWNKSIPNAVWTDNNGTTRKPTGTLYWKPESNQQSNLPYIFTIMVRKNSSPMNAQYSESFQIYAKKPSLIKNTSNEILVYPNPVLDACMVRNKNKKLRIISGELINAEGRIVSIYSNVNSYELKIERAQLNVGNYIIRLNVSDGKSYSAKLNFN